MLVVLYMYACRDFMKIYKISTQMEYVLILIISIIFCSSVIIYYFNLPRNRLTENIFIYIFFGLLKLSRNYNIPKFLELK